MSSAMIVWPSLGIKKLYNYLTSESIGTVHPIRLKSVDIHDVETAPEHRPRTLKHLLKANHVNYAIYFNELRYHNHMSHILGSSYLMGASPDQLQHLYVEEGKQLEAWEDSPAEVTETDWKEFLGDKRYQRAYVDFFEDQLALKFSYNWKTVADEYLFAGKNPLINCLITGLGHPMIHLGYGYELNSREVGVEALAAAATSYNDLHKYIDDRSYTKPSSFASTSPLELLHKMRTDDRFQNLDDLGSEDYYEILMDKQEDLILEYWNAWTFDNPVEQFQQSQEAALSLLVATVQPGTHAYDFFFVHLLTTSHAVRIILPMIPDRYHISLVRQWWLLTVMTYVGQHRPRIEDDLIDRPKLKGKHWSYVEDRAVNGPYATDAHFVKALRAMREAAMTWGDVHEWYLTAAVRFADDFKGWTGFGRS